MCGFFIIFILTGLCYKVKKSIFLLNENIRFNKNEAESKTEKSKLGFREMKLVL